jgi:hypothetical protein
LDIEIFTLLRAQTVEVFNFLIALREFADDKGLQSDVARINVSIGENRQMLRLANRQLAELKNHEISRMAFFETMKTF